MKKTIFAAALSVIAISSHAATFGRVIHVSAENRLVVQLERGEESIALASVEPLAADHEWRARLIARMSRELAGKWVMLESEGAAFRVYRSPDGMFVNEWVIEEGIGRTSCGACPRLAHLEKKARVTGQGYWIVAGSISREQLSTPDVLGELSPAGGAKVERTSSRKRAPERSRKRK